jgi:hypothetical protein
LAVWSPDGWLRTGDLFAHQSSAATGELQAQDLLIILDQAKTEFRRGHRAKEWTGGDDWMLALLTWLDQDNRPAVVPGFLLDCPQPDNYRGRCNFGRADTRPTRAWQALVGDIASIGRLGSGLWLVDEWVGEGRESIHLVARAHLDGWSKRTLELDFAGTTTPSGYFHPPTLDLLTGLPMRERDLDSVRENPHFEKWYTRTAIPLLDSVVNAAMGHAASRNPVPRLERSRAWLRAALITDPDARDECFRELTQHDLTAETVSSRYAPEDATHATLSDLTGLDLSEAVDLEDWVAWDVWWGTDNEPQAHRPD